MVRRMIIKCHENISRSITKAVTFRIIVLICDGFIVYAVTRRYDIAIGVIFFSNISSTIIYFLHERAWNGIHWGRMKK